MSEQHGIFSKGNWIVHARYGIGRVEGAENKILDGKYQSFLKVKASDCMYWLPLAHLNNDRVRPVTSKYRLQKALKLMRQAPVEMSGDHHQREKEVGEVFRDTSLYATARLIRDLNARLAEGRVNFTEEETLKRLKDQFLDEWWVVEDVDRTLLEERLSEILAESLSKKRWARR